MPSQGQYGSLKRVIERKFFKTISAYTENTNLIFKTLKKNIHLVTLYPFKHLRMSGEMWPLLEWREGTGRVGPEPQEQEAGPEPQQQGGGQE
jgi:hypothetical protein